MMSKTNAPITKSTTEACQELARKASTIHVTLDDAQQLKKRALLFQALGNEARLKILGVLSVQEICTCDIVEALDSTASTVAFHLRMLEDAGLIASRRAGKFTLYRLNNEAIEYHRVFG